MTTTERGTMRQIEQVAHHRNGITGEPFDVVTFTDDDGSPMLGVVFDAPDVDYPDAPSCPRVAVFNRDMLAAGEISFGVNSHRGDAYADFLYAAVAAVAA